MVESRGEDGKKDIVPDAKEDLKANVDISHKAESDSMIDSERRKGLFTWKEGALLIIGTVVIIGIILAIIYLPGRLQGPPKTREELFIENFNKRPTETNYIYKGYSFIKLSDPRTTRVFWYTQLKKDGKTYEIPMHYGPLELENISVNNINPLELRNYSRMVITVDPAGDDNYTMQYVALSVSEFSEKMIKVNSYPLVAACTRNETLACIDRPIVDCGVDNESIIVKFQEESSIPSITVDGNCLIIDGTGEDLLKATDRLIYILVGIMK